MSFTTYLLWATTPFYQRWWFWVLLLISLFFLAFYVFRWWAGKRYRSIMEARQRANARIGELLKEMRERR